MTIGYVASKTDPLVPSPPQCKILCHGARSAVGERYVAGPSLRNEGSCDVASVLKESTA
jgi:hypothetical protein